MNRNWMKFSILPAAMLLVGTAAMAQSTTTTTPDPTIAQRKEEQQQRIGNGVQSGQLTAGETANLETKEAAINGETKADRAANGGKLTSAEKTQINGQQNKLSNQIYDDKHNANVQHNGTSEVGDRKENQQQRIAQGVKSGQLTAGETAKLENNQRAINQETRADRAANGGKLTPGEKAQVNRQQNRQSRQIYNKKHNNRTQGGTKH